MVTVIVVGAAPGDVLGGIESRAEGSEFASALQESIGKSGAIIADGRIAAGSIRAGIGEAPKAGVAYLPIEDGDDILELPALALENLVPFFASASALPVGFFSISKEILADIGASGNPRELFLKALCAAVNRGDPIQKLSGIGTFSKAGEAFTPSSREYAEGLKYLVQTVAIEELYPNHPWQTHESESLAASYHALAALFLRFGDASAAKECLSSSDKFEDSPRSLALKALIAKNNGETLGAVANMVSSLQQYELRKTNDGSHYLNFTPKNLEIINSNLLQGLEALNKLDNERAMKHFAEAVFEFDPFYREYKLDALNE